MEHASLPSLHDLLPIVHVDSAALRHIRTLFYSATKSHEHLANLSTSEQRGAPPSITITTLLPTISVPPSNTPLNTPLSTPLLTSTEARTIPLFSNLSHQSPPSRRPTNSISSLLTLFPPLATCQTSPPLQLHVTLPKVRHRLSNQTDIAKSAITLAQNSLAILLSTGQSSETAGLLLTSRPKSRSTSSSETLHPASFNASGDVAGVWVCGSDANTATLALHALAAAWWTRRNRRLSRLRRQCATSPQAPEWYERRIWLVHFREAGRVFVQSGVIAVRNDVGLRYVATLCDASHPAHFEQVDSASSRVSEGMLGHGWRGGWVPSSSLHTPVGNVQPNESSSLSGAAQKNGNGQSHSVDSRQQRIINQHVGGRRRRSCDQDAASSAHGGRATDNDQEQESADEDEDEDEDDLLTARMRTLNFHGRDSLMADGENVVRESERDRFEGNTTFRAATPNKSPTGTQRKSTFIQQVGALLGSESDGEECAGSELSMEELCNKYLNSGYREQVLRYQKSYSSK